MRGNSTASSLIFSKTSFTISIWTALTEVHIVTFYVSRTGQCQFPKLLSRITLLVLTSLCFKCIYIDNGLKVNSL